MNFFEENLTLDDKQVFSEWINRLREGLNQKMQEKSRLFDYNFKANLPNNPQGVRRFVWETDDTKKSCWIVKNSTIRCTFSVFANDEIPAIPSISPNKNHAILYSPATQM